MDEAAACGIAEAARGAHGVPPDFQLTGAQRRIIEIGAQAPDRPGKVRDCVAWLVRFAHEIAWIELGVDDQTGLVVRVRRSR